MISGIDLSTVLTVGAIALAAIFVVLEQWKGQRPFRSWKLWLALIFLAVSLAAALIESESSKRFEREREADLKLIQKLNSGLNSLCIEINLRQPDPVYRDGCGIQLHTQLPVADLTTTGLFAEYIVFHFSPDSGWYRDQRWDLRWPSIVLDHDSARNTVRFEMSPFGVKWKGQLAWKAERINDLTQVRMGLQVDYSINLESRSYPPDTMWSPVRSVSLFANDYKLENLITSLIPHRRSYATDFNTIYFHPQGQPIKDPDNFNFNIDLLQMRSNILHSLDAE